MNVNSRKPDFLVIGVQKSATTWLQERLRQHPDVFMPRDELHYFDRDKNYERGEEWYLKHFAGATQHQILGEKTPDYIWTNCENVPGISSKKHNRIFDFKPSIKLIIIFRNPIERFVSAIHHNQRRGRIPADLSVTDILSGKGPKELLERMLQQGFYATQLHSYFEVFDRKQIKILFHEDVITKPDVTITEVQSFLGIRDLLGLNSGVPLESNKKRYNDYNATILGSYLQGRTKGLLNKFFIKFDRYIFVHFPFKKVEYPKLTNEDRSYLQKFYRNEMEEFSRLVRCDMPKKWGF